MSRTRNILFIAILLFLLAVTFRRLDTTLFRRRAHNRFLRGRWARPYQAPAHGCEWPDVIRGSYFIFLHHGCALAEHLQSVDARLRHAGRLSDLASQVTHVWPETKHHGLYYIADGLDTWALRDIRYEVAVDLVECNRAPEVDLGREDVVILNRTA